MQDDPMLGFVKRIVNEVRVAHFLLVDILSELRIMASAMTELKNAVEEQSTVVDSVLTLVSTLAEQIRDAKDDPEEIQKLADQLEKNTQKLSEAVVVNTDSPEAPVDPEVPSDPA
jgi:methyl-accepting chemotaxis protein